MFSSRPVALPGVPSTRLAPRHMIEQWDARRGFPVPRDVVRLLSGALERFGREDANATYIGAARGMETWTVRDAAGTVVGAIPMVRHFPNVAEARLMVVERGHHGREAGRAMIEALERDVRDGGVRLLMVRTLGPSHPDPGHARTHRFCE